MLYESQYYGICDLGDVVSHHGIKGQKWGTRRFQNDDGSLTDAGRARYLTGDERLTKRGEKKYVKESKKLRKLQDRANVGLQKQKAEEYSKRAGKAAKVATVAGGIAVGSYLGRNPLNVAAGIAQKKGRAALNAVDKSQSQIMTRGWERLAEVTKDPGWAKGDPAVKARYNKITADVYSKLDKNDIEHATARAAYKKNVDILNTINTVRKGIGYAAAGTAAVSGGVYAYNKLQERAAKKRTTEVGHRKAVENLKKHQERMGLMFDSVKLEDLSKRRRKV